MTWSVSIVLANFRMSSFTLVVSDLSVALAPGLCCSGLFVGVTVTIFIGLADSSLLFVVVLLSDLSDMGR